MTVAYAKLSLRMGMLAGAADHCLGGNAFIETGRFLAWTLTHRTLIELQSAAMSLGVPERAILEADQAATEEFRMWGPLLLRMQDEKDRESEMSGSPIEKIV